MHVASCKISGFYQTIFIDTRMSFVAISTFTFTIGAGFYIPIRFWVLCRLTIFVLVRSALLCFNDAGIDDADTT